MKILFSNRNSAMGKMGTIKTLLLLLIIFLLVNVIISKEEINKEEITESKALEIEFDSEEVDLKKGLDVSEPGESKEYLFVSTLEGNIHAYSAGNNKELWKISLGKPLITSNINTRNIIFDTNAIIPGLDGNIYRYIKNEEENKESYLKKVDIPLKTLIDNSPFTFPNIPNYIFIGDKRSSMFTIDVDRGLVLTKHLNGEEDNIMQRRPVQSNNLLTIIRIDYTLMCMSQETGGQSWNVTVSEVMAIQKGTKSEITAKKDSVEECGLDGCKQSELNNKLQLLMDSNPNLNSVVSVHKYSDNDQIPVKIYDVKPDSDKRYLDNEDVKKENNNFVDYFQEWYGKKNKSENEGDENSTYSSKNNTNNDDTKNAFYDILSDYLKWAKLKLKNKNNVNENRTWLNFLIFKFWEMYYYQDYFFIYMTIIVFLSFSVIILISISINFFRRNQLLEQEKRILSDSQKRKKKHSDASNHSLNNSELISYKQEFVLKEVPQKIEEKNDSVTENFNPVPITEKNDPELPENLLTRQETGLVVYKDLCNPFSNMEMELETKSRQNNDIVITEDNNLNSPVNVLKKLDSHIKKNFEGLKSFQKEKICKKEDNFYQDDDGSFVHEENLKVITKYENNSEVADKLKQIGKQINVLAISNEAETKGFIKEDKEDKDDGSDTQIGINYSIVVKQTKEETQIILNKNQPMTKDLQEESEIVEMDSKNYENANYANYEDKKKCMQLQLYKPKAGSRSITISIYNDNKRKNNKRKIKEYSYVNNEKINKTHIDEGRLDKTFEDIEKIGQGGFGCVFKARHKIDGSYYAIKMIELKVSLSKNLMEHKVIKEVKTMMKLNHKNVVRYTTCWFQLNIESVKDKIDMSRMSELNSSMSASKSNFHSNTYSKIKSNKKNNFALDKTKTMLNQISENEEKSSYKSRSGFNWDETLTKKEESIMFLKEDSDKGALQDIDKAFSVSLEKAKDEDLSDESNKNSYDDSHSCWPSKSSKEPTYQVYFFMQMEFCDGLSFNQYLDYNKEKGLDKKQIFSFFKQIASGVNHIHKNNVIHRDLKPHNIFIFGKDSLKIGDFGLATEMTTRDKCKGVNSTHNNFNATHDSVKFSEYVGTPLYQSPEQTEGLNYNQKVDIYAMGIILFEMCGAFKTGMERRESIELLKKEHEINETILHKFPLESKLILLMTNLKPGDRPTSQEVIDSDIFKNWKSEQE